MIMVIKTSLTSLPPHQPNWHERWEGPDKGLICAWLQGIDKARSDPAIASKAVKGELPVTAFKGGIDKPPKNIDVVKVGALHYVAYWQGLRGEDLCIDQDAELMLTCSRTGVTFRYCTETSKLLGVTDAEDSLP